MTYDFHGSWESVTGSNAALEGSDISVTSVVQKYIDQNVTVSKIVIGLPVYARVFTLNNDATAQQNQNLLKRDLKAMLKKRSQGCVPKRNENDGANGNNGNPAASPTEKVISNSKVPGYGVKAAAGKLGKCSGEPAMLPYFELVALFNKPGVIRDENSPQKGLRALSGNQWISYDNEETIKAKVAYINDKNLGGAMMWAIDQDTKDFSYSKAVVNHLWGTSTQQ
jgi:chitinase